MFVVQFFLLTVMSGLSQLERDLISQRTKEGLVSAKARGAMAADQANKMRRLKW